MNEIELYKMLNISKHNLTRQEYSTIKGQINKKDYLGAYKGIKTCIERKNVKVR